MKWLWLVLVQGLHKHRFQFTLTPTLSPCVHPALAGYLTGGQTLSWTFCSAPSTTALRKPQGYSRVSSISVCLSNKEKINTKQKFCFWGEMPAASPTARGCSESSLGLRAPQAPSQRHAGTAQQRLDYLESEHLLVLTPYPRPGFPH